MRIEATGRGVPPAVSTSTFLAWHLDEAGGSTAADLIGNARPLAAAGALPTPTIVGAPVTNARAFTGTEVLSRAAVAADIAFAQGAWTASYWVRVTAASGAQEAHVVLAGASNLEDEPNNSQLEMGVMSDVSGVTTVAVPYAGWEHGAGVNDTFTVSATAFFFEVGQWTLVTWRKTTSPALALECLINGVVVATFAPGNNASHSGSLATQAWKLGAALNATPAVTAGSNAEIANVTLTSGVQTDLQVQTDFRRGLLLEAQSAVHFRALVADQSDVLRDLTDPTVAGADFALSGTLTDEGDNPCESLELVLAREHGDLSLAPLRGDSRLNNPTLAGSWTPMIDVWRRVQLDVARVPTWLTPESTDWWTRFVGRVEEYDDGGETLKLQCRDQGARIEARWIDQQRQYPNAADLGTGGCGGSAGSRETTLARILADNGALATLFVPLATGSCLVEKTDPEDDYVQRGLLLPTLRGIAQQIGWDVNFKRWDPATLAFRLTLFEPKRSQLAPDFHLFASDVFSTETGATNVNEIRNRVTVTYPDSTKRDNRGGALKSSVTVDDAGSQAAYDIRAMEAQEDATSQIDTSTEATRMANAILADLSSARRTTSVETLCFPELQTQDFVGVQADLLRTTALYKGAVKSFRHAFGRDKSSSTLGLEGQPSRGTDAWLSLEPSRKFAKALGLPPIRDELDGNSARALSTKFPVMDAAQNRSIYTARGKFVGVKNHDFESITRGPNQMPDAWRVTVGTFGVNIAISTTTQLSGGRALRFVAGTATDIEVRSEKVPIGGDARLPLGVELTVAKTAAVSGDAPLAAIAFYDADQVLISTTTALAYDPKQINEFRTIRRDTPIIPPADARFAELVISRTVAPTGDVFIDSATIYRYAREVRAVLSADQAGISPYDPLAPVFDKVLVDSALDAPATLLDGYDFGGTFDAPNNQLVIREAGTYSIEAEVRVEIGGGGTLTQAFAVLAVDTIFAAHGAQQTVLQDGANGQVYCPVRWTGFLDVDTVVELYVAAETVGGGGTRTVIGSGVTRPYTWLYAKLQSLE